MLKVLRSKSNQQRKKNQERGLRENKIVWATSSLLIIWRWVYLIKSLSLATNRKKIHSSWELVFNVSRPPWKDLPKHLNEIKMTKLMAITLVRENVRDWDLDKFKFGIDQWNTGLSKRSQSNGIWLFKHDRLHFWIKFFQLFTRSLWWEVVLEYFKYK